MTLSLAIYDLDKTITRRPTFTPFLLHAVRTRFPARFLLTPFALGAVLLYVLRLIDRGHLKELNHALLLGSRVPRGEADALARSFAAATVAHNVLPRALAAIAQDRAAGQRLVLATASYAFYAEAIGRALGFDHVIATRCAERDGAVLARIEGENCYGAAKRRMVETWLAASGRARADCHIRFYSDHVSDVPMFEWADEPVAINAHAPLAALARERGWRSEEWR